MNIKLNKYLADIINSIDCIDEFVGSPKIYTNYESSKLLQSAVERHI